MILLLCAATAFAPYWFGRQAEVTYRQQFAQLQRAGVAAVQVDQYQRGWFSSSARSDVTLGRAPLRIVARHRIYPGPFPADEPLAHLRALRPLRAVIVTRGELVVSDGQSKLPFTARTMIGMDGDAQTRFEIPGGELSLNGGGELTWHTARGRLRWGQELHGTLTSEGLDLTTTDTRATIGLTSASFVSYPGPGGLEMGRNAITVASVRVRADTDADIAELYLESQAAEAADNTVGYALLAKFTDARYAEQPFGPGKIALEIGPLDAGSLTTLRHREPQGSPPLPAWRGLIRAITRQRAAAVGRAELSEPGGKTSMRLRMHVARPPEGPDLRALLRVIDAVVELEAPRAMIARFARRSVATELEKLASQGNIPALDETQTQRIMNTAINRRIDSWTDEGLVVPDGERDRYVLEAVYLGGDLRVNGNSIDLLSVAR